MASTLQDRLYEVFVAVSGEQTSIRNGTIDTGEQLATLASDTGKLIRTAEASIATRSAQAPFSPYTSNPPATTTPANGATSPTGTMGTTAASLLNTVFGGIPLVGGIQSAQTAGSSGGIGSTVEAIASTVLKSGFGALPLIGGLLGLFGGGGSPDPPPLVKYAMPASIDFQSAETRAGFANVDYDQSGRPRAYAGASSSTPPDTPTPQITVNVQAMDARSFLDRSSDIAAAVRDAMLNLNSINDVVNDL